jgi:hypothetical protein
MAVLPTPLFPTRTSFGAKVRGDALRVVKKWSERSEREHFGGYLERGTGKCGESWVGDSRRIGKGGGDEWWCRGGTIRCSEPRWNFGGEAGAAKKLKTD